MKITVCDSCGQKCEKNVWSPFSKYDSPEVGVGERMYCATICVEASYASIDLCPKCVAKQLIQHIETALAAALNPKPVPIPEPEPSEEKIQPTEQPTPEPTCEQTT